jgi:hypothetical protein
MYLKTKTPPPTYNIREFFLWPNSYLDSLTKKRNTNPIPISALKSRTTETNGQVGVSILIQFVITVSEHDVPVMHMPRILQLIKPIIPLPMNHLESKQFRQLLVRHFYVTARHATV